MSDTNTELKDDTVKTDAVGANVRVFGAESSAAARPSSYGRDALYKTARAALADDAAASRTNLGLGTMALETASDYSTAAEVTSEIGAATASMLESSDIGSTVQAWDAQLDSLSSASANGVSLVTAANYAAMRTLLDLEIGVDVQAYDADLTTLGAGGSGARDFLALGTSNSPQFTGIELGHASDTTLARVAAGRASIEGAELAFARLYDVSSPQFAGDIQAAIDAASAAGGGTVMVPYGTYALGTTGLTLKSGVMIMGLGWPTITYTGTGEMIGSASTGVLLNAGLSGFVLNHGADATHGINLRSPYHCRVQDIRFLGSAASAVALRVGVNTSGDTNPSSNRNAAFCHVTSIQHDGTCGTLIQMGGGSSASEVVTLNTFDNIHCRDARVRGWDFEKWVDNNYCGFSRVSIVGDNTVGAEYNSDDPSNNAGVYTNNFGLLAVDTFGTYTGRVGLKINHAKQLDIVLYQNPQAEGGSVSIAAAATAIRVREYDDPTTSVIEHSKSHTISAIGAPVEYTRTDGAALRSTNSTDAASNTAIILRSARATPAANDDVHILAQLNDSTGAATSFASLRFAGSTVTDGAETGQMRLNLAVSGSLSERYIWAPLTFAPASNDLAALGTGALSWSDLFLAAGGVINWANGGITITEASDNLAFAGATTSYQFDKRLHVTVADTAQALLLSGASKGIRVVAGATTMLIEGVDNTGAASYQPLVIGASDLTFSINGTGEVGINATALFPKTSDGSALGAGTNMWADLFLASGGVINFNNGNLTMTHSAGALAITGVTTVASATATPANGSTSARLLFGTTAGFGIYYGSGAPSVSAAQGSIYLRSDGSSTSTRLYVNTDGSTTWTNVTTAA
jgi:hypothetical protein